MERLINNDWWPVLAPTFVSPDFTHLNEFVAHERQIATVFPPVDEVYNAFTYSDFATTRVVILGQDPYHGPNQAHGLSFSVVQGTPIPPSLRNIYQELADDVGVTPVQSGDLTAWAKQGVLLLNTVLTVRQGEANSHQKKGWEAVTDAAILALSQKDTPVVFILWGRPAQQKRKLIDETKNLVIASPHPSPLSSYRGFFGSKPFSKTNEYLIAHAQQPIDWQLPI